MGIAQKTGVETLGVLAVLPNPFASAHFMPLVCIEYSSPEVMPFTGARRYQTSPGPANAYYLQCFLDETYYVDIVVATNQRGSGQVGSLSTKYPVHRPPSLLQSVQIEHFR